MISTRGSLRVSRGCRRCRIVDNRAIAERVNEWRGLFGHLLVLYKFPNPQFWTTPETIFSRGNNSVLDESVYGGYRDSGLRDLGFGIQQPPGNNLGNQTPITPVMTDWLLQRRRWRSRRRGAGISGRNSCEWHPLLPRRRELLTLAPSLSQFPCFSTSTFSSSSSRIASAEHIIITTPYIGLLPSIPIYIFMYIQDMYEFPR